MTAENQISKVLAANLKSPDFTPYNDRFFFDENLLAREYAKIFGIEPDEKWFEAFRIATEGQGDEIRKINSLISSSLLSLLAFHKLYRNESDLRLELALPGKGTVRFDKCLFEARNKVVRRPSCVDVVLYSSESNVLLFLESKFTEYFSVSEKELYGKGYIDLYNQYLSKALSDGLEIDTDKEKLLLKTKENKERYIEGIKQSVSHLVGLVRGPYKGGSGYYPEEYHNRYQELYNKADELFYGTILYDPKELKVDNAPFEDYVELYRGTIGAYGQEIVEGIRKWDSEPMGSHGNDKKIAVLPEPLTYQSLFKEAANSLLLTDTVLRFYNLRK